VFIAADEHEIHIGAVLTIGEVSERFDETRDVLVRTEPADIHDQGAGARQTERHEARRRARMIEAVENRIARLADDVNPLTVDPELVAQRLPRVVRTRRNASGL